DGAVDAEEQFPEALRDRCESLERAGAVTASEHHDGSGDDDQWAADEPEPGDRPRHEPGAEHHVAENQPVAPADDPAGAEQERPVLDRRERVRDRPFGGACSLLLQGGDPEHRDDATRMKVHSTSLAVT